MKKSEFLENLHLAVNLYDRFCMDKHEELKFNKVKKIELAGEAGQCIGIIPNTPSIVFETNPIAQTIMTISHSELQYSVPLIMSKSESAWEYFTLQ